MAETSKPRTRRPRRKVFDSAAISQRTIRASYDVARTTDENENLWKYVDALSAADANSPTVRRTIRNRARYETANNSYAEPLAERTHLRTATRAYRATPPVEGEPLAGAICEFSIGCSSNLSSRTLIELSVSHADGAGGSPWTEPRIRLETHWASCASSCGGGGVLAGR